MLGRPELQGITDGFAAVALGAFVVAILRRRPKSPLDLRLAFAFGGLCLFFLSRAAAVVSGTHGFAFASQFLACALPAAALFLVEGVLRRHAPRVLKLAVVAGGVSLACALMVSGGRPPVSTWGLGGFVVVSLAVLTALAASRDRSSLSRQENASVDGLILAGAALAMLSVTDFMPTWPLGMTGAGAAALSFVAWAAPSSRRAVGAVVGDIAVLAVLGAAFGTVLAAGTGLAEALRLSVAALTLLLAAAGVLRALRRRTGDEGADFRRALAAADISGLPAFLDSTAGQPMLHGLRLAQGGALADYDGEVLGAGLQAAIPRRPVWTAAALSQPGALEPEQAREELCDLLARTEATHAALVSRRPLRIALLTLPGVGDADAAEADLALFRTLAAAAAAREPA